MAIDSFDETQKIVLSTILKDSYVLAKVKDDIRIQYFNKFTYKIIYKSVLYFYHKYGKLASELELILVIKDLLTEDVCSLEEIQQDLHELYELPVSSLEFTTDQVTRFVKRKRLENTLKEFLPKIKDGDSLCIDEFGERLSESVTLSLHNSKAFQISNLEQLDDVRRESVGSDDNPTIVKSVVSSINDSLLYKGYKSGDIAIIVAKPGCGKTMFMVNELANAARQGYNALHLFIGDMTEYDGLVRYLSNISGVMQDDIASMNLECQRNLVSNLNNESDVLHRITVKSYAASEISVEQMIEDVFKIQNDLKIHYDIIAVDYPDNLIKSQESMYESGGDIYNRLSYLARRNKCVVLAGSQPKISNWSDEIIPLSGCAESSKKQHIADLIIALGRPSNDSKLLTGFLAKVRRGTMGTIFRLKTEFERARLELISEFDYVQLKSGAAEERKLKDR